MSPVLHHTVNAQTPPADLISDALALETNVYKPIINYDGDFTTHLTDRAVFNTTNSGHIYINSLGEIATSDNASHPDARLVALAALGKNYFNNFSFNTIKHILFSRMKIADSHIAQFASLPQQLTYWDLEENQITLRGGVTRILQLLNTHNQRLLIKIDENFTTDPQLVGQVSQGLPQTVQEKTTISIDSNWAIQKIKSIIYNPEQKSETPHEYDIASCKAYLENARNNNAHSFSTQLFPDELSGFIHYSDKTEWYDFQDQNNVSIKTILHSGLNITAAFLSGDKKTIGLSSANQTWLLNAETAAPLGSASGEFPYYKTSNGFPHVAYTSLADGLLEKLSEVNMRWKFNAATPISYDGQFFATISPKNEVLVWRRYAENGACYKSVHTAPQQSTRVQKVNFTDDERSLTITYDVQNAQEAPKIINHPLLIESLRK